MSCFSQLYFPTYFSRKVWPKSEKIKPIHMHCCAMENSHGWLWHGRTRDGMSSHVLTACMLHNFNNALSVNNIWQLWITWLSKSCTKGHLWTLVGQLSSVLPCSAYWTDVILSILQNCSIYSSQATICNKMEGKEGNSHRHSKTPIPKLRWRGTSRRCVHKCSLFLPAGRTEISEDNYGRTLKN